MGKRGQITKMISRIWVEELKKGGGGGGRCETKERVGEKAGKNQAFPLPSLNSLFYLAPPSGYLHTCQNNEHLIISSSAYCHTCTRDTKTFSFLYSLILTKLILSMRWKSWKSGTYCGTSDFVKVSKRLYGQYVLPFMKYSLWRLQIIVDLMFKLHKYSRLKVHVATLK